MARFRFRLERVLSVRQHQEERERMRFAAALRRKTLAEQEVESIKKEIVSAVTQAAEKMAGMTTVDDLVRLYDYRIALMRKQDLAEKDLEAATADFEAARRHLIEARKKRRVLERLRERHHLLWREDEGRKEQDDLDEIGLASFQRRELEPEEVAAQ